MTTKDDAATEPSERELLLLAAERGHLAIYRKGRADALAGVRKLAGTIRYVSNAAAEAGSKDVAAAYAKCANEIEALLPAAPETEGDPLT